MSRSVGSLWVFLLLTAACGDNDHAIANLVPDATPVTPDAPLGSPPPPDSPPPDITPPDTTITQAPPSAATTADASFAFTGTDSNDTFECALDGAAFAACVSPAMITVADGQHTFAVRAIDAAGNVDPTPASVTWTVNTKCGNGTIDDGEQCDGTNLAAATCGTMGFTGGDLACSSTCGFDTSACTDTYVATVGFTGTPCFDGIRFSTPALTTPYALACTDHNGVYRTALDAAGTWVNTGSTGGVTNLNGRAVATNPDGPPVYYLSDGSDTTTNNNAFRSNNNGMTWTSQSIANNGVARELYSLVFRQGVGNVAGTWDATLGATVLHGNAPAGMMAHFVGATAGSVTGTVRGIADGGPHDVYVAVYGQTPAGDSATGGIFWACDLQQSGAGGTWTERDQGIAAADLGLVWSITVDGKTVNTTPFACGDSTSSGSATTYYAALRGGGQVYKTVDSGMTWTQSNSGLPAGAEVYEIAIDCFYSDMPAANKCDNDQRLYAATNMGLYRSLDAGAHWVLDGFAGQTVRAVAVNPNPTPGLPIQVLVGVDDATGIYQTQPLPVVPPAVKRAAVHKR